MQPMQFYEPLPKTNKIQSDFEKGYEHTSIQTTHPEDNPAGDSIAKQQHSFSLIIKKQEKLPTLKVLRIEPLFSSFDNKQLKNHQKTLKYLKGDIKSKQGFLKNVDDSAKTIPSPNWALSRQSNKNRVPDWMKSKTVQRKQKNKLSHRRYLDQLTDVPFLKVINYQPEKVMLSTLPNINAQQLMFKIDHENEQQNYFEAFFITKMCMVKCVKFNKESLKNQQHPNIIPIYGKIKIKLSYYIIMNNFEGQSLASNFEKYGPCNEKFIKKYIKELIEVVIFCKKQKILLTSITPSNIYCNKEGSCMIDLFECTKQAKSKNPSINQIFYLSPEFLTCNDFTQKSMVWSIGCIVLSMVFGRKVNEKILCHPYNKKIENVGSIEASVWQKIAKMLERVLKLQKNQIKKLSENKNNVEYIECSEQLCNFLDACLKIDKKNRPLLEELGNFNFLQQ